LSTKGDGGQNGPKMSRWVIEGTLQKFGSFPLKEEWKILLRLSIARQKPKTGETGSGGFVK